VWTRQKTTLFSGHYLRNRSTLDIGVLGYIGILYIRNTLPKSGTFLLGHPVYSHEWKRSKNGRMEQSKAMEYESRKASSDVLKPHDISNYVCRFRISCDMPGPVGLFVIAVRQIATISYPSAHFVIVHFAEKLHQILHTCTFVRNVTVHHFRRCCRWNRTRLRVRHVVSTVAFSLTLNLLAPTTVGARINL